jgi:hypothetical protein
LFGCDGGIFFPALDDVPEQRESECDSCTSGKEDNAVELAQRPYAAIRSFYRYCLASVTVISYAINMFRIAATHLVEARD